MYLSISVFWEETYIYKNDPHIWASLRGLAGSRAAKIWIIFDKTNFLARKITQKWFSLTYLYLIMLNSECKLQYSLCSCKIVILSFIRLNHSNICTYEHSYYMSCVLYCYFGTWQYYVSFASNKIFKSIICNDKELEMYVSLASSYYSIIVSFIYCNTASDQYDSTTMVK